MGRARESTRTRDENAVFAYDFGYEPQRVLSWLNEYARRERRWQAMQAGAADSLCRFREAAERLRPALEPGKADEFLTRAADLERRLGIDRRRYARRGTESALAIRTEGAQLPSSPSAAALGSNELMTWLAFGAALGRWAAAHDPTAALPPFRPIVSAASALPPAAFALIPRLHAMANLPLAGTRDADVERRLRAAVTGGPLNGLWEGDDPPGKGEPLDDHAVYVAMLLYADEVRARLVARVVPIPADQPPPGKDDDGRIHWDEKAFILKYKGENILRLDPGKAIHPQLLLKAFQDQGWPAVIDYTQELDGDPLIVAQRHNIVYKINRRMADMRQCSIEDIPVKFHVDGTQISVEYRSES